MNDNSLTLHALLTGTDEMWRELLAKQGQSHPMEGYRLEPYVLRHGAAEKRGHPLPKWVEKGTPKECFSNAGRLALADDRLTYCEGFAMRDNLQFPIHHAWARNESGAIIDATWNDPTDCTYLGIEFPTKFLRKWTFRNKYWGLLASSWSINVELMKDFETLKSGKKWRAK